MEIKVLIVEDDMIQQIVLTKQLTTIDDVKCTVTTASDGKEAVELCTDEDFDLIIMDFSLPDQNGYVTAKAIRAIKTIPTVWCSGYLDPAKKGAGDFDWYDKLVKPYNSDHLIKIVKSIAK